MGTEAQGKAKAAAETLAFQLRSRQAGPGSRGSMGVGVCLANGWIVDNDRLSGDYDLDEPVARQLLGQLMAQPAPTGPTLNAWQPPAARPGPSLSGAGDWMQDYLFGDSGDNAFGTQMQGATLGPGNILGNTAAAAQAAAFARSQAQASAGAMDRALQAVRSGAAKAVKLNEFIEIYNANTGKGRPRPRLRIRGLPMKVIQAAAAGGTAAGTWRAQSGGRVSAPWKQPNAAVSRALGAAAADARWGGGRWGWTSRMPGAGILTFAPSAAIDAVNSLQYSTTAKGQQQLSGFDTHKFVVNSAKSQSGNMLGMLASMGVGALLVGTSLAGAPVLLLALGAGILVQAVWSSSGGADWVAGQVDRATSR